MNQNDDEQRINDKKECRLESLKVKKIVNKMTKVKVKLKDIVKLKVTHYNHIECDFRMEFCSVGCRFNQTMFT